MTLTFGIYKKKNIYLADCKADVDADTDDGWRTTAYPIRSLAASCSGELKSKKFSSNAGKCEDRIQAQSNKVISLTRA